MRLLNVTSFKLESFDDENRIPHYLVLSHRWEGDEVLFHDLQESPQDVEIQELRKNLDDMEQRFKQLEHRLEAGSERVTQVQGDTPQQGSSTSSAQSTEDDKTNLLQSFPHLRRAIQKEPGWAKTYGCCKEAKALGFSHVWIDTCCINKDSSSELSEAINSMFSWYKNASLCIAYLSDVSFENMAEDFPMSKWFTRGWTLQELLAPHDVWFYSRDWQYLGLRSALATQIAEIASVDATVLDERGRAFIGNFTVASVFSWAARRECSRAEDRSYSLLGLFGIYMPTIYGEGEQAAFFRLQIEIFKVTPDHSIFAWEKGTSRGPPVRSIFANTIDYFESASSITSIDDSIESLNLRVETKVKYSKFSHGIRIWLPIRRHGSDQFLAYLHCYRPGSNRALTLILGEPRKGNFIRMCEALLEVEVNQLKDRQWFMKEISIPHPKIDRGIGRRFGPPSRPVSLVNDEQVLSAGFERLRCSSGFLTAKNIAGVPLSDVESSFLDALAVFTDLSSLGTQPSRKLKSKRMYTLVYFNKITMALFALIVQAPDYPWPPLITVVEPASFGKGSKILGRSLANKTLASGWRVWGRFCPSMLGTSQLILNVKPLTPLDR